ncbi:tRNA (cytosine(34)-C(5))-methyltransferase, mitochondrial-like isoform X2 [Polyodon spathula]|uniref:tRNA (cytosine(34)-C(5))-methyltransferase, mitochondrial-like isoform X2 n=1 Tax=Polyodon spathula TaxID=7913 RepID=UPI001B7F7579|nr:tRNA (cytosine(34)-C(5))-methyltransferase, mitochondrial-like isoform X2 [Polyodon spathula]
MQRLHARLQKCFAVFDRDVYNVKWMCRYTCIAADIHTAERKYDCCTYLNKNVRGNSDKSCKRTPQKQICQVVLQHFDQQYHEELGEAWSTAREALLCPAGWQYAVMMNRFNLSVEMMQSLKCQGYSSLLKDAPGSSYSSLQCFVSKTQSRLPSQQHRPGKLKHYYLLNAASLLPVLALEASDGDKILDLCSAPGGKSIAILQTGILHCNEWDILRWKWLKQTLESFLPTDLYNAVMVSNLDGRHIGEREPGMYDKVLVDAPCSNDRSWLFSSDYVQAGTRIEQRDKLPALQKQLLRSAIEALRPGGTVVYSTCTLSRAENSDVVASMLSSCDNVELVDLTGQMASVSQHFTFAPGNTLGHLVIPERGKTWGPMYVAKLKKLY